MFLFTFIENFQTMSEYSHFGLLKLFRENILLKAMNVFTPVSILASTFPAEAYVDVNPPNFFDLSAL